MSTRLFYIRGLGHLLTFNQSLSYFYSYKLSGLFKYLTFDLFTQVSDSGPYGPVVYYYYFFLDIIKSERVGGQND